MDQALVRGRRVLVGFAVLTAAFLAFPTPATAPALAADPVAGSTPNRYISEVVDSIYMVGPAEFFALDLPTQTASARAIHLLGTVSIADRKGDIIVRLFRGPEYQNWLKKKGGDKSGAFYVSKRLRTISLDMDLPDGPVVLLLDNGYSVRTPKHVHTQIQIQYERAGAVEASTPGSSTDSSLPPPDDFIAPRSNTEEESPPPPPPPPDGQ